MKAAWTWSLAVMASLGVGFSGEAQAIDVFSGGTTVRRPVAVDYKQDVAKQDKEKTAFGCYGGVGCGPYGCGVGVGFGGCGYGNCGYGGGCGYGRGCGCRRGGCYGGCGYGSGCGSICAPCGDICSPCGVGYGYQSYGPAYIGGGCGTGCGYGGYGGYGVAPVYSTPGYGVAPYGGYGAGYGPSPFYGVYGSNTNGNTDGDDADTMPVSASPRARRGMMQGGMMQGGMMQDRDDSPYFQTPARSFRQYGPSQDRDF